MPYAYTALKFVYLDHYGVFHAGILQMYFILFNNCKVII